LSRAKRYFVKPTLTVTSPDMQSSINITAVQFPIETIKQAAPLATDEIKVDILKARG